MRARYEFNEINKGRNRRWIRYYLKNVFTQWDRTLAEYEKEWGAEIPPHIYNETAQVALLAISAYKYKGGALPFVEFSVKRYDVEGKEYQGRADLEIFFKENRKSIALEAAEARPRVKLSSNRQKRDSQYKIGTVCRKKWEGIKDDIRNLADVGFPRIALLFVIPWGLSCSGGQEDLDYFKEIIRKIAVSKMKADFVVSRFPDRRRYLEDFIDSPGIMAIGKIYYRRKDIR